MNIYRRGIIQSLYRGIMFGSIAVLVIEASLARAHTMRTGYAFLFVFATGLALVDIFRIFFLTPKACG